MVIMELLQKTIGTLLLALLMLSILWRMLLPAVLRGLGVVVEGYVFDRGTRLCVMARSTISAIAMNITGKRILITKGSMKILFTSGGMEGTRKCAVSLCWLP